mmetsp:Transcript_41605/g.97601  ORF Transcript_41605/g.97601 Transcript_41605/m.97601 type:complete len:597 (+) Transcript_41605:92-1882(+)
MLRTCSWPLAASLAFLLASSASSQQQTETQRRHEHQHHHSWGWFFQDMCGCTPTKYEGCGLSSEQLYKDLTESYGLNVCRDTNLAGDSRPDKTADWLTEKHDSPELIKRITEECAARQRLAEVAKSYEKCLHVGESKEACTSDKNKDHCEWEAQDVGKCGIDEEKLLREFVGPELHGHPLVRNIMIQDTCSEMSEKACTQNTTCAWETWHHRCVANAAVTFSAFIEHPALFEVLDRADYGSQCRAWNENVWHGATCYQGFCHLERGICTSHVKDAREVAVANTTAIMIMKNDLCQHSGNQLVGGERVGCPQGCHEHVYTAEEKEQMKQWQSHHPERNGAGWSWCEADEIDASKDMKMTDEDRKVALFFTIIRSATQIGEARCNSLDSDMLQCQKVAQEHINCDGMFHPNATEVFGDWHRRHDQHHHDEDGKAVNVVSDAKPTEASKAVQEGVMQNVQKQIKSDGGIGFNGQAMTQMTNSDAVLQNFSGWLEQKETQTYLEELQQNTPEILKGFRQMWADAAPKEQKVAKASDGPEEQAGLTGQVALLCVVCLVLAGTCGGFACAVIFTNRLRDARGPALLETQYVRHQEPAGAAQA